MSDYYVDTDVVGGLGDGTSWANAYSSMSAAVVNTGLAQDLVTAVDQMTIHWRGEDTTPVTFGTNWVTSATYYLKIVVDQADRHPGYWSASHPRLDVTTGPAILCTNVDYLRLEGLQVNGDSAQLIYSAADTGELHVSHCIGQGHATAFQNAFDFRSAGVTYYIYRNIIYNQTGAESVGIYTTSGTAHYIYNNTIKDCSRGIRNNNATQEYVKGNIVDCTDAFVGTFTDNDTFNNYNHSSQNLDEVVLGTNGSFNASFTYANEAGDDFHLDSADTGAIDKGVNLGTPYDVDIDGQSVTGTWDAGADEYISGATIIPQVAHHSNIILG